MLKFLGFLLLLFSAVAQADDTCRETLRRKICLATTSLNKGFETPLWERDPILGVREYLRNIQETPCTPATEQMAQDFVSAYDELPELPKKLLCGIRRVLVTTEDQFGAAVSTVYDPESVKIVATEPYQDQFLLHTFEVRAVGTDLWINAERFTPVRSQESWLTEHLHFIFTTGPGELPEFKLKETTLTSLASTLVHEMGHVLEASNPRYTGFWSYSFVKDAQGYPVVKSPDDPVLKGAILKQPSLTPEETPRAVDFLKRNSLVSYYAAVSPSEDFADTFAYIYQPETVINYQGRKIWDGRELEKTDAVLAAKLAYIRQMASDPLVSLSESNLPALKMQIYLNKP